MSRTEVKKMLQLNIIIVTVLLSCVFAQQEEGIYSDKFDYINEQEIFNDVQLRNSYYNCFIETDDSSCVTDEAKFFKGIIDEAILTNCRKCTQRQHEMLNYARSWYLTNQPLMWDALLSKATSEVTKKIKPIIKLPFP